MKKKINKTQMFANFEKMLTDALCTSIGSKVGDDVAARQKPVFVVPDAEGDICCPECHVYIPTAISQTKFCHHCGQALTFDPPTDCPDEDYGDDDDDL